MNVLETDRLVLRRLTVEDVAFVHELVNDEAWLRYIGDKGVRTLEDAADYIRKGPLAMYERHGFGLMLTALKADGTPIGMCGLIKRDTLDDVDIGLAFLPAFRRHGYAFESASAVLAYGQAAFGLKRIVAITSPDNEASIRILEQLGFHFEKTIALSEDGLPTKLFARNF
ncbi:hypothetical protein AYO41_02800 [Verrucomicrobia bacterium SCGC AG-212-E04]|nr:hypothetical protein AYO41_02800 [Verrucomicrobia bacterium SCGC AG-212-E04]